jgi:hypothetical protein
VLDDRPPTIHFTFFAHSSSRPSVCRFDVARRKLLRSEGPFTLGEEYPEEPATCETIKYWADRAPRTEDRISLGITGKLKAVKFDGTLAYLLMCEPPGVQVMCVTYSTNGLEAGDVVLFGGGYRRVGERQIMLDPCLASR